MAIACLVEPTYSLWPANKQISYKYGFNSHATCPTNSIYEIIGVPYNTSLDGHQKGHHKIYPRVLPFTQHPLE